MKKIIAPLIMGLLFFITIMSSRAPDVGIDLSKKISADYVFSNVQISLLKNGKKLWTITASDSTIYKTSSSCLLNNIKGTFYDHSRPGAFLKFDSPVGVYNFNKNILKFTHTKSELSIKDSHYFVICDELEINSNKKEFKAYGNIQINTEGIIFKSNKMLANLNENKIYLSNNVEGTFITNTSN